MHIKTHNLPTLSSGLMFLKKIPDFGLSFCLMLSREGWEFDSITQVLCWQYFSPVLWVFVWFCATFWLCSGGLLGFGNPRDEIIPLTAFSCQKLLRILHRKPYRTVVCVWGGVYFPIFKFFIFLYNFSAVVSGDRLGRALNRAYFGIPLPFRNLLSRMYLCVSLYSWS